MDGADIRRLRVEVAPKARSAGGRQLRRPMPKDRRNAPTFLPHIVEELARDRGEAVAATAANATAAARDFFRLPPVVATTPVAP